MAQPLLEEFNFSDLNEEEKTENSPQLTTLNQPNAWHALAADKKLAEEVEEAMELAITEQEESSRLGFGESDSEEESDKEKKKEEKKITKNIVPSPDEKKIVSTKPVPSKKVELKTKFEAPKPKLMKQKKTELKKESKEVKSQKKTVPPPNKVKSSTSAIPKSKPEPAKPELTIRKHLTISSESKVGKSETIINSTTSIRNSSDDTENQFAGTCKVPDINWDFLVPFVTPRLLFHLFHLILFFFSSSNKKRKATEDVKSCVKRSCECTDCAKQGMFFFLFCFFSSFFLAREHQETLNMFQERFLKIQQEWDKIVSENKSLIQEVMTKWK